ncbi:MAG TPA: type 1 glutamine amidotransferase family protein [Pedobacter sp.]|uniref:type 1 glutamine amidotransferase family protein n=1 Tax=Pedobacter sp. TaxID=1411316 RepID=UPI002D0B74D1|nr:type 1 glutamine amidotransferase family protein [Pedobacter sp.]HMI01647.1 type 1 glutamine amidotransferase family protein [Pedobacter sp.]
MKKIYLYLIDTLADWEPGYAIAELNSGRYFKKDAMRYAVKTVGLTKASVTSLGGIKMTPDYAINEIDGENAGLLLLPGADTWADAMHTPVFDLVKKFLKAGIPVGAICGATVGLANAGILDDRKHTSNDLEFLKQTCPGYKGSSNYVQAPAVSDRNLITATGLAPLEFAREIFEHLDVMEDKTLNAWYQLYTTREAKYFYELMESVS